MKIEYLSISAGPNGVYSIGDHREGSKEDLQPVVDAGYARVIEEDKPKRASKKIETAEAEPKAEKATTRRRRG
jgi:hypothetical protein